MNSHEIRKLFTAFFAERGHEVVPSASLVPHDDPTLLFTNAGMVPFKDVFTNRRKAPYTRAVSVQRCVRAGGKHNDLENVGYTTRHHTLFEMLGNFSFGDYFKQDAISYAWSFLIEVLKLEPEKLWITVHDSDQEAADLWEKYVPVERIIKLGDEDNYWAMGPTGPNGPCSEIYYDHGPDVEGGRPGSPTAEGDRYVEIWNLVFMQYETLASGKRIKLPKPCVDTGLGLERLAAVMNGVTSGYETDVFIPLLVAAGVAAGISDQNEAIANTSLRVIADHVRSTSMLIVDGVLPSNEGRGYVLRRIIRRALRHTKKLGMANNSFSALSQTLANQMQDDWPALYAERTEIAATLEKETTLFVQTLKQGTKLLEDALQKQTQSGRGVKRISGDVIFKLYDTYGFPPDLTADIARERGLDMDLAGFEAAMRKQMELGKAGHKFSANALSAVGTGETTNFIGYNDHSMEAAVVRALYRLDMQVEEAGAKGEAKDVIVGVDELKQDEHGIVILEQTCFYAKSGGQIGDIGELTWNGGSFNITDTTKNADCIQHQGRMSVGCLRVGEAVEGAIDAERRVRIRRAHSATHLLHAALRKVLGDHVVQKGSLVEIDRLTFDFSHTNAVSQAELEEIEGLVNAQVRGNSVVEIEVMAPDAARSSGALALFGEKYGDAVRVLTMGDDNFSKELCGGTHVRRTGDIGTFQIVGESGIAAGIRRIEAVTGEVAVEAMTRHKLVLQRVASRLKTDIATLLDKIKQNQEENKTLRKVTQRLSAKLSEQLVSEMATEAEDIGGIKLLASEIERSLETNNVMGMMDQLKLKLGDSVILLAWIESGRVNLVASVSQNVTDRIKASDLVNVAAKIVGAKGGGRAELARAGGGEQVELVSQAITAARDFSRRKLSA